MYMTIFLFDSLRIIHFRKHIFVIEGFEFFNFVYL